MTKQRVRSAEIGRQSRGGGGARPSPAVVQRPATSATVDRHAVLRSLAETQDDTSDRLRRLRQDVERARLKLEGLAVHGDVLGLKFEQATQTIGGAERADRLADAERAFARLADRARDVAAEIAALRDGLGRDALETGGPLDAAACKTGVFARRRDCPIWRQAASRGRPIGACPFDN